MESKRVTDERLFQLCEDFETHVKRFEKHEARETETFTKLFNAQEANTKAITKMTESVSNLVEDTSDIIQIHNNIKGAAAVGSSVQNFMFWLMKWGLIGAGLATAIKWVIKHFLTN